MKVFYILIISMFAATALTAQNFKSHNVSYKIGDKDYSNTVYIPEYDEYSTIPIRGVIHRAKGPLSDFSYNNHVAMFAKPDQGRGFSKELLKAAAKASGRPEIEFAGAIVQGISKGGREAADWAHANQERAIAVILDHSAIWHDHFPKRVTGVPMFFNATYADMYQNIDRRKSHFGWCSKAFGAKQACTSIIDHAKKGGHGGRGSTDLTAIWLKEAMNFRVPLIVPVGKAYKLTDVDPNKCGGYVSAQISMDGKRSYHDKVKVSLKSAGANWWVPGPKSAALYLKWVVENGGSVENDESSKIINGPMFTDLNAEQTRILGLIKNSRWSQAFQQIEASKSQKDIVINIFKQQVKDNINDHLKLIDGLGKAGDLYGVYLLLKEHAATYKGISHYDKRLALYSEKFKAKENSQLLMAGRDFYSIMERINGSKKLNKFNLAPLKNLAAKHTDNLYGKAAQKAFDKLSADLTLKLQPQSFFN